MLSMSTVNYYLLFKSSSMYTIPCFTRSNLYDILLLIWEQAKYHKNLSNYYVFSELSLPMLSNGYRYCKNVIWSKLWTHGWKARQTFPTSPAWGKRPPWCWLLVMAAPAGRKRCRGVESSLSYRKPEIFENGKWNIHNLGDKNRTASRFMQLVHGHTLLGVSIPLVNNFTALNTPLNNQCIPFMQLWYWKLEFLNIYLKSLSKFWKGVWNLWQE